MSATAAARSNNGTLPGSRPRSGTSAKEACESGYCVLPYIFQKMTYPEGHPKIQMTEEETADSFRRALRRLERTRKAADALAQSAKSWSKSKTMRVQAPSSTARSSSMTSTSTTNTSSTLATNLAHHGTTDAGASPRTKLPDAYLASFPPLQDLNMGEVSIDPNVTSGGNIASGSPGFSSSLNLPYAGSPRGPRRMEPSSTSGVMYGKNPFAELFSASKRNWVTASSPSPPGDGKVWSGVGECTLNDALLSAPVVVAAPEEETAAPNKDNKTAGTIFKPAEVEMARAAVVPSSYLDDDEDVIEEGPTHVLESTVVKDIDLLNPAAKSSYLNDRARYLMLRRRRDVLLRKKAKLIQEKKSGYKYMQPNDVEAAVQLEQDYGAPSTVGQTKAVSGNLSASGGSSSTSGKELDYVTLPDGTQVPTTQRDAKAYTVGQSQYEASKVLSKRDEPKSMVLALSRVARELRRLDLDSLKELLPALTFDTDVVLEAERGLGYRVDPMFVRNLELTEKHQKMTMSSTDERNKNIVEGAQGESLHAPASFRSAGRGAEFFSGAKASPEMQLLFPNLRDVNLPDLQFQCGSPLAKLLKLVSKAEGGSLVRNLTLDGNMLDFQDIKYTLETNRNTLLRGSDPQSQMLWRDSRRLLTDHEKNVAELTGKTFKGWDSHSGEFRKPVSLEYLAAMARGEDVSEFFPKEEGGSRHLQGRKRRGLQRAATLVSARQGMMKLSSSSASSTMRTASSTATRIDPSSASATVMLSSSSEATTMASGFGMEDDGAQRGMGGAGGPGRKRIHKSKKQSRVFFAGGQSAGARPDSPIRRAGRDELAQLARKNVQTSTGIVKKSGFTESDEELDIALDRIEEKCRIQFFPEMTTTCLDMLKLHENLQYLSLRRCGIDEQAVKKLILPVSIETLVLDDNPLLDMGLLYFLKANPLIFGALPVAIRKLIRDYSPSEASEGEDSDAGDFDLDEFRKSCMLEEEDEDTAGEEEGVGEMNTTSGGAAAHKKAAGAGQNHVVVSPSSRVGPGCTSVSPRGGSGRNSPRRKESNLAVKSLREQTKSLDGRAEEKNTAAARGKQHVDQGESSKLLDSSSSSTETRLQNLSLRNCGLCVGNLLSLLFADNSPPLKVLDVSENPALYASYIEAAPTCKLEELWLEECNLSIENLKLLLKPFLHCGLKAVHVGRNIDLLGEGDKKKPRNRSGQLVKEEFTRLTFKNITLFHQENIPKTLNYIGFRNLDLESRSMIDIVWNLLRDRVEIDLGGNPLMGLSGISMLLLSLRGARAKDPRLQSPTGATAKQSFFGLLPSDEEDEAESGGKKEWPPNSRRNPRQDLSRKKRFRHLTLRYDGSIYPPVLDARAWRNLQAITAELKEDWGITLISDCVEGHMLTNLLPPVGS
ncbi:unnamed protein product [Amoebophrya sp. A25]|nr:unnamed protein product [Amoebophrya sp. A25]|eukprot:GSA25T00006336001.1